MKLIAESGSTKTDWRIISSDEVVGLFSTKGINPLVQNITEIEKSQMEALSRFRNSSISQIDFYGAGCGTENSKNKIRNFIKGVFPYSEIQIESDLIAAARALFGNKAGIVCILGTGSNSGYYDGTKIVERVPSLGYILGDEGGGVQIGKQILIDFLRKNLPSNIQSFLQSKLSLSESEILDKVYQQSYPNRFMANLVSLLNTELPENEYLSKIIKNQFNLFFNNCLLKYSTINRSEIGFVGSIAHYNKGILKEVAAAHNLKVHNIIQRPIEILTSKESLEMDFVNNNN